MILAASQMALSMVLVVLAGLFTKSLSNLNRVDPGFKVDNLITFSLSPQRNGYTPERSALLFADLEEEFSALPGVSEVTSSTTPLLSDNVRLTQVFVEGFDAGPNADRHTRYDEIGPRVTFVRLVFHWSPGVNSYRRIQRTPPAWRS